MATTDSRVDQATGEYPDPELNPYLVHLRALREDTRDIKVEVAASKTAIQYQNGRVRHLEDAVHRIDAAIVLLSERSLRVPELESTVRALVQESERAAERQRIAVETEAQRARVLAEAQGVRDRQLDRATKLVSLVSGTGVLSWLATLLWPVIGHAIRP